MKKLKLILLCVILCSGILLMLAMYAQKANTPLDSSFAPLFQLLGEPVKTVDNVVTTIMPIDEMDEKDYGNSARSYFLRSANSSDPDYIYLNSIMKNISAFSKKPFTYQAFVYQSGMPNAFALPSGVILVTRGLLNLLDTEAQLTSILAHEIGHIECGHCFSAVKFELLTKKMEVPELGQLADFLTQLFLRHSYSKTQENEADEFGYKLLLTTEYNPSATAQTFKKMKAYVDSYTGGAQDLEHADLLRDYFMSHPPLILRQNKFNEDAKKWWKVNGGKKRYNGKQNLKQRVSFYSSAFKNEWAVSDTI